MSYKLTENFEIDNFSPNDNFIAVLFIFISLEYQIFIVTNLHQPVNYEILSTPIIG